MENWQKYNLVAEEWKKVTFPGRPSPEGILVFDELIEKHNRHPIYVLK